MFKRFFTAAVMIAALCTALVAVPQVSSAAVYKFSGGPSGGTFMYYANGISQYAKNMGFKVLASASNGSVENVRLVNGNRAQFAVAYSGDTYLARNGKLKGDNSKYEDVMALGYFYGAPAHLIVRANSDINTPQDLEGKRVGVGGAGSGAAANAERFFGVLGLWDKMKPQFIGYRNAAAAFKNKQLDAFWVFAGYPNSSVIEAALQTKVKILDIYDVAQSGGVLDEYPFLAKVTIPAGTYKGQTEPVQTFQGNAIWIANKDVPADVVYDMVKAVYSEKGMEHMISIHKSAKAMSVEGGLTGIVTPLHPGAEKFWKEVGVLK
ncbi:TAXI family TRAP transporter solute-binding subunit [Limisalsivibrio acetivorans]|uniref:TAXI family TRAP transporter solute-binding subunit n=1 Tax=Limisalsivibrio acetivorans TaxID=1304888 RepID=UPI0003B74992|nr:TAXI family TRAP transporter solute-binding subunit [Limisalsivibrio acetivorans]